MASLRVQSREEKCQSLQQQITTNIYFEIKSSNTKIIKLPHQLKLDMQFIFYQWEISLEQSKTFTWLECLRANCIIRCSNYIRLTVPVSVKVSVTFFRKQKYGNSSSYWKAEETFQFRSWTCQTLYLNSRKRCRL